MTQQATEQAQQNFQPQVRDTTNGPNLHTYIPRSDGAIMVGDIAYYPSSQTAAVPPVTIALATPPYIIPPGQPLGMGPTAPTNPMIYPMQMPYIQQPQTIYSNSYCIQPQAPIGAIPSYSIQQPAFGTIGLTSHELFSQQMATAQGLEMNKKQEMKPADDDPNRFYWVRELDNSWSQRNRLTIDSGDIGDCRWYAKDGEFYAVRLPAS